jgi:hypothetical protein
MEKIVHNPDRYMGDLRQMLAQGRKRIGILLGAGSPASIRIDKNTGLLSPNGEPLIPTINDLTIIVLKQLDKNYSDVIKNISKDIGEKPNIEQILSRVRLLSSVIGCNSVYGCDGASYLQLSNHICDKIGTIVGVPLPQEDNPYLELVRWISGVNRSNSIEIFTPNYDLLIEESLEKIEIPFFDGFSGGYEPFFDPVSISNDDLPSRWVKLWKLHGSLGWAVNSNNRVIRGKGRSASQLIYPDHQKYDQIQKLPYSALFDHLRNFLITPDTLLLSCGFSYGDAHITAVIDESLAANPASSVFAFQYESLAKEVNACMLAGKRPNMSVFARDGAMINCISAPWVLGKVPTDDWESIRKTYWGKNIYNEKEEEFLLGDFALFTRFIALTRAEFVSTSIPKLEEDNL